MSVITVPTQYLKCDSCPTRVPWSGGETTKTPLPDGWQRLELDWLFKHRCPACVARLEAE